MQQRHPHHTVLASVEPPAKTDSSRLKTELSGRKALAARRVRQAGNDIQTSQIAFLAEDWLADCLLAQGSLTTEKTRRLYIKLLIKFLNSRGYESCGEYEMRQFQTNLTNGHHKSGGRWGEGAAFGGTKPLRPVTILSYYRHLSAFFKYLVAQGILDVSPLDALPRPKAKPDKPEPFTNDELEALLAACRHCRYKERNEALLILFLSSGLRASELCGLRMKDLDLFERKAKVLRKGNSYQTVGFGRRAAQALLAYLGEEIRRPEEPVFLAERSGSKQDALGLGMTPSAVLQLIRKLAKRAGLQHTRCYTHKLRHTFAFQAAQSKEWDPFEIQHQLGHEKISTTMLYVNLANSDPAKAHRRFSPGDQLKRRK